MIPILIGPAFSDVSPVLYVPSVVVNLAGGVSPGHPLVLYVRWVSRIGRCLLSRLELPWPMTGLGTVWREPGAQPTTLDPSSSQPNVNASRPKHKRKTQTHKRKTQTHKKKTQIHKRKTQTHKRQIQTKDRKIPDKGYLQTCVPCPLCLIPAQIQTSALLFHAGKAMIGPGFNKSIADSAMQGHRFY